MPQKETPHEQKVWLQTELRTVDWDELKQQLEKRKSGESLFFTKFSTIVVGLIAIVVGWDTNVDRTLFLPLIITGVLAVGVGIWLSIGKHSVSKINWSGGVFMLVGVAAIWYGATKLSISPQTAGISVTVGSALEYLGMKRRNDAEKIVADLNTIPDDAESKRRRIIDQIYAVMNSNELDDDMVEFIDPDSSSTRTRAWLLDGRVIVYYHCIEMHFLQKDKFQVMEKGKGRFSKKIKVAYNINNSGWINGLIEPENFDIYTSWK